MSNYNNDNELTVPGHHDSAAAGEGENQQLVERTASENINFKERTNSEILEGRK
jgi:hypothetical protein